MLPGPPLKCRSVCRESKKSPMARSWRSFFRRNPDEEQEQATEDLEEGNGHHPTDLEAMVEEASEEVSAAEEVQADFPTRPPADLGAASAGCGENRGTPHARYGGS